VEWLTALDRVSAFGLDPSNGDVLVVADPYGPSAIYRLTSVPVAGSFPGTLSETGLFADLSDLAPNPGLLGYEPNVSFWSDFADKRRWFAVPEAKNLGWAREGPWTLPEGMLWVKHFDLETERGNPATKRRIETRVLVKNPAGVYGVSYRWNAAQTDATLAPDEGVEFPIDVLENGLPRTQTWHIPSRSECRSCHNAAAGYALSFNTRQLNRAAVIGGFPGNEIDLLHVGGFFSNAPESTNVLPRYIRADETAFSIEARARSYLAVNCAFCHQPGGGASPTWDGRAPLTLAQTQLINGTANNNGGNAANKLIVPGDTVHSIVFGRASAAPGFPRMPPIATNEVDPAVGTLLGEWIGTALLARETYDQWRASWFGPGITPEGEPANDPDGDGRANGAEFIVGTNPTTSGGAAAPTLSVTGDSIQLSFDLPTDRVFHIEASNDLLEWHLWDVPGNNGLSQSGGPISLSGPVTGPQQFFRFWISEP
jgi:mono/diheme cytochrome c family protein